MNSIQLTIISLIAIFFGLRILFFRKKQIANSYIKYLFLMFAGFIFTIPFFWLISASFKDKRVFNEYNFLPPMHSWLAKTTVNKKDIRQWNALVLNLAKPEIMDNFAPIIGNSTRDLIFELQKKIKLENKNWTVALNQITDDITKVESQIENTEQQEKIKALELKLLQGELDYKKKLENIIQEKDKNTLIVAFNKVMEKPNWYQHVGLENITEQTPELKKFQKNLLAGKIKASDPEIYQRFNRLVFENMFATEVLISRSVNIDSFRKLFKPRTTLQGEVYFWQYIINSLFLATCVTFIQLVFCSMGGYALSAYNFPGRSAFTLFMLGTLMVPPMMLFPPLFELIVKIGLMDSYLALIAPGAVSAYGIFLFRQTISRLPDGLLESARLDGCNEFRIYLNIVMPLVKPMTGAFCLITFLFNWNSFIAPQVFLHAQSKLTLPVVLTEYLGLYSQEYGVFLAGTFLSILPPAILFFFLQKEFISGLSEGAMKQ